ncbi:MAG: ABC transporter ATP-binding protein [Bacillota bacterium]|nr:ABC transporter ATP-binding protein [Bacillota bacterium]
MEAIRALEVSKVFHSPGKPEVQALKGIDLTVEQGEFLCIVGATGCGKSTFLNIVAGFEVPSSGEVFVFGTPVKGVNPRCGMIFQQYALFPWLTVEQNVEFGLCMRGVSPRERREIAQRYIALVGLTGFERSYPKHLSGGMKQRVAIARALANDPQILLMDEPFAALDAMTRQVMQEELLRLYRESGKTVLFVTHSIDEALLLSTRILVMTARPGRVKMEIRNDLPWPRSAAVQLTDRYQELKSSIWDAVQEEVMAGAGFAARRER